MSKQQLHSALAPIDVLTRLEMEEIQRKGIDDFIHQEALGVSYYEWNGSGDGKDTYTIPGPESGYAWSLKLVSAVLTNANNATFLYLGDSAIGAPVAYDASSAVQYPIFTFTSNVLIVNAGRNLTITSAGLINGIKLIAKQVPSEMVAKL